MEEKLPQQSRLARVLETVVNIVIILVIVQTFLDDFAILMSWDKSVVDILVFTGFFFDLFFTIEFLVRLYNAVFIENKGRHYLVHGKGWIDFLASVPLLMFSSGPALLALLLNTAGWGRLGKMLNLLKIIKVIRIARVLRLLRILKIFKSIKYADSCMAQRHIAKLTTISVILIIAGVFCYTPLMESITSLHNDLFTNTPQSQLLTLLDTGKKVNDAVIRNITTLRNDILLIRQDGKVHYSRYDKDYYQKEMNPQDYFMITGTGQSGRWQVFIDMRNRNKANELQHTGQSLFFFAMILAMVFVFLFIYSPHFALTVSDPVNIMIRGFERADYNLTVKIPEIYKQDEIFTLAGLYNEVYLPLKDRKKNETTPVPLKLQLNDIKDLLH